MGKARIQGQNRGYVGRRRATSRRGPPEAPELQRWTQVASLSIGRSGVVRLILTIAVAAVAVAVGLELGMTIGAPPGGDRSGSDRGRAITTPPSAPPLTPPVPTVSVRDPSAAASPEPSLSDALPLATGTPGQQPSEHRPLVLDNFDDSAQWRRSLNDLGEWTGADAFDNGGGNGDGVVCADRLTLVYRNTGYFGSEVETDVSAYHYVVLRVRGVTGGEEHDMKLGLGGVDRLLADFRLDGGRQPVITTAYRDIRIPMAINGINTRNPGALRLSFWWGGTSTVVIDEIRFE